MYITYHYNSQPSALPTTCRLEHAFPDKLGGLVISGVAVAYHGIGHPIASPEPYICCWYSDYSQDCEGTSALPLAGCLWARSFPWEFAKYEPVRGGFLWRDTEPVSTLSSSEVYVLAIKVKYSKSRIGITIKY